MSIKVKQNRRLARTFALGLAAAIIGAIAHQPAAEARSVVQNEFYPRAAGSWGGKLRSGPGMQYRQVGSTFNGQGITLLQNTGQWMNGYPWFRIRTNNGRTGYQWGGIMCGMNEQVPGLHRMCNRTSSTNNNPPVNNGNNGNNNGGNSSRTVTYDCQNGPPLIVTYTRGWNNNVSVRYVYDGPRHAMRTMVQTHARHFRDGNNSLSFNPDPRNVEYREGNNLFDRCWAVSGL